MKKFIISFIVCLSSIFLLGSCDTMTYATSTSYGYSDDIIVRNGVCYIYYENPTTTFLNTLHIIDGSYYYWHSDRYIPVYFPRWHDWSPYRHSYFNGNRWLWKDRVVYNHDAFRKRFAYPDFRRHPYKMNPRPTINFMRRKNISIPNPPQKRIGGSFGNMRRIPNNNHFGGRR